MQVYHGTKFDGYLFSDVICTRFQNEGIIFSLL